MTRDTTGNAGSGAGAGVEAGATVDGSAGVKAGVPARAAGEGSGAASGRAPGPPIRVGRRARYAVEWVAVRAVAAVISRLPLDTVRRCGTLLGRAAYAVDGWHRRIASENLAAAFPGRTPDERDAVVRAMFEHFGRLLLELIRFGALDREQMLAAIDTEGEERVWQAYQKGRGVLFFTGHFGYWEMQAIVQPLTVRPVSVLARPLDNPRLDAMLERIRTCTGNAVIYRQGAIRKVLRELGANHGIAMLIDQHLHSPDVVQVDYFGRPVATTSALAALAVRTGAPVIPVFALPLPHGRYRMVFEHPVDPPATDAPDAIREFTQRCTDVLEMYVRRHPDLWLWMHRRWREPRPASAGTTPHSDPTSRPDTTSRPDAGSAG
ncbi:MAG: lysophospholipid acyltransferase family protein [Vicinamibacterales bacterium]